MSSQSPTQPDLFERRFDFIIKLGCALHQFGTPAHRLEAHLRNVANAFGLQGSFLLMPTALTFALDDPDKGGQISRTLRVSPGELDLGSLARTDELVDNLDQGKLTLEQAAIRLEEIINKPNPYSTWSTLLAFGASGGAFAMLMATSWNDVLWSSLLSLVNFAIVLLAERSGRVANMLEPLVALVSAVLGNAIAQFDPGINIPLVVLSSIIIFIPGLSISTGLAELSNRHLLSGTARFMDGLMTMFKLYFGAVLGMTIGVLLWGEFNYMAPQPIPDWTKWLAVFTLSACLVVGFRTRLKDAPWAMASGFLAYIVTLWASQYLDVAMSAFVGAFAVGIYANLYSRLMKAPALIASLHGVVLLVPGSKVYIGLNTLVSGEAMVATPGIGPQTLLIFMSLVAGLIFSNVVLPPSRSL